MPEKPAQGAGRASAPDTPDASSPSAADASQLKNEQERPENPSDSQYNDTAQAQPDASAANDTNIPELIVKRSDSPPSVETTRPRHTPKPSDYIRRLECGEGTTTGSARAPVVPCGMRAAPKADDTSAGAAADTLQAGALEAFVRDVDEERIELEEVEMVGRKWEGIEWAMGAETTEGLEPCNVEEARQ